MLIPSIKASFNTFGRLGKGNFLRKLKQRIGDATKVGFLIESMEGAC